MDQNNEDKPTSVAATPQQAGEARDLWWWVERSVWTERMLTRLTSGESADRVWFRLWDKTYAPANLDRAFGKVWHKRGSGSTDRGALCAARPGRTGLAAHAIAGRAVSSATGSAGLDTQAR
jgi:hypothetical protein